MGRWSLVSFGLLVACGAGASPRAETATAPSIESKLVDAYPTDTSPGVRARVVCAVSSALPTRWVDVAVRGETRIERCEEYARGECGDHPDLVRACSTEPLPVLLVPRGVFVGHQGLPMVDRYQTFATAEECEAAMRERNPDEHGERLEARIETARRELDAAAASVKAAERRLAGARAVQSADIPLLQLEVEELRRKRTGAENVLSYLRERRSEIVCIRASGS